MKPVENTVTSTKKRARVESHTRVTRLHTFCHSSSTFDSPLETTHDQTNSRHYAGTKNTDFTNTIAKQCRDQYCSARKTIKNSKADERHCQKECGGNLWQSLNHGPGIDLSHGEGTLGHACEPTHNRNHHPGEHQSDQVDMH